MAKYYSSRVAEKITSRAIEIFGGYGYTRIIRGEVFSGLQDRVHLRRHDPHATRHHRQAGPQPVARISQCAVERRSLLVGANPTRQLSLQPVAVGAVHGGNDMD